MKTQEAKAKVKREIESSLEATNRELQNQLDRANARIDWLETHCVKDFITKLPGRRKTHLRLSFIFEEDECLREAIDRHMPTGPNWKQESC